MDNKEYVAATWNDNGRDLLYFLIDERSFSGIEKYNGMDRFILALSEDAVAQLCSLFVTPEGKPTLKAESILKSYKK